MLGSILGEVKSKENGSFNIDSGSLAVTSVLKLGQRGEGHQYPLSSFCVPGISKWVNPSNPMKEIY